MHLARRFRSRCLDGRQGPVQRGAVDLALNEHPAGSQQNRDPKVIQARELGIGIDVEGVEFGIPRPQERLCLLA